jgi:hypothetical protein
MIRYQSAVEIAAPPAAVFPYLVERDQAARWSDVQMRPLTDGPMRAGTRMELTFGRRPLQAKVVLEIAALEDPRRLAFVTVGRGPIDWTGEYRVEPMGESGSRVRQAGELRFHALWRLLEPIVGAEIRSGELKELERLKVVVEGDRAGGS